MTFVGILLRILLLLVGIILVLLVAAFLSGRDRRAYAVLSDSSSVKIAGKSLRVPELALEYQPRYYLPRKISEISTPLVSSVVLPLLLDAATKLASKSLGLS